MDVTVLAAEAELPMHPIGFGVLAFIGLVLLLAITLSFGKGRPHS